MSEAPGYTGWTRAAAPVCASVASSPIAQDIHSDQTLSGARYV